jgi:hypothetical protein
MSDQQVLENEKINSQITEIYGTFLDEYSEERQKKPDSKLSDVDFDKKKKDEEPKE